MSDLTELFNKDPLELSEVDIDTIIEELRKMRVGAMQQVKQGKKPQARLPSLSKEQLAKISVDDLLNGTL